MVIRGVQRYSDRELLSIVGACAQLGFDDDMLLDKVTTRLLQHVQDLSAEQLLDLVCTFFTCTVTDGIDT